MVPRRSLARLTRRVFAGSILLAAANLCLPGVALSASFKAHPAWVLEKPSAKTQIQQTTAERGINPCNVSDPGFKGYKKWQGIGGSAYVAIPQNLARKQNKTYNVVIHFHGREAARKQWVHGNSQIVFVGVDLGIGSGAYLDRYADPSELPRLLEGVHRLVEETTGRHDFKRGKLALTSWSAGYGATLRILLTPWGAKNVDGVVLLDGLHTSVNGGQLETAKLKPFADFAAKATRGEKFMFVSHSSIIPPGYASTTATSNYLVWAVGGKPSKTNRQPKLPWGLHQINSFKRGQFEVRGFEGNAKADHCAQFGLLDSVIKPELQKRWRRISP